MKNFGKERKIRAKFTKGHDGENSWDSDKSTKIWYKIIWLDSIFIGSHEYHTIEEKIYDKFIDLTEGQQKININYRFWYKKYKRFYMKPFNNKGKSIIIKSDIKYPIRKETEIDIQEKEKYNLKPDYLERTLSDSHIILKETENISDAIKQYKEKIYSLRNCKDWVPYEYRKNHYREKKLKRILNGK